MSDNTLTPQQELFAQEYAKCGNGTQSYRKAYPKSEKWKDNSIHINASKLVADAKVSLRIAELKEELNKKGMWSREESVKILKEIACETFTNNTERVNALKELNKMHGYEAAKVLDHKSTDGSMSSNVTVSFVKPKKK